MYSYNDFLATIPGEIEQDTISDIGEIMLILSGADGLVAKQEMEFFISLFRDMNASESLISKWQEFDWANTAIDSYAPLFASLSKSCQQWILYHSIKIASADGDYAFEERAAIRKLAASLDISPTIVAAAEALVELGNVVIKSRHRIVGGSAESAGDPDQTIYEINLHDREPIVFAGLSGDNIRNIGQLVLIIAGADGEIASSEMGRLLDFGRIHGASDTILENWKTFPWHQANLDQHLEELRAVDESALHRMIYIAIKVAEADDIYSEMERRAIYYVGKSLGLDPVDLATIHGLVMMERALPAVVRTLFESDEKNSVESQIYASRIWDESGIMMVQRSNLETPPRSVIDDLPQRILLLTSSSFQGDLIHEMIRCGSGAHNIIDVILINTPDHQPIILEQDEDFDFVIIDIGFAETSTDEILECLAQVSPKIPAIALASTRHETLARKLLEHGTQDYLIKKELTCLRLVNAIVYAVRRKRLECELRATKEDAELANNEKSRLLANMSHELRTPLNAIIGFTDLLQIEHYGELNEKQMDYVETVNDSGKHLLSLISDLLDIAKVDTGAMTVDIGLIEMPKLINSVIDMLNTELSEKKLKIRPVIASSLTLLSGDEKVLKQILINLLSNAIKYSPDDGEIKVTVTLQGREFVKIEVTDQGIGVPKNKQINIFSEFYQVDNHRDAGLGGTGIGLALAKRLARMLGGSIGVTSDGQTGSTFWFTFLYISPESKQDATQTPNAKRASPSTHRILVVEDNEANRKLMVDILQIENHTILIAKDGAEAIERAISGQPELIFMDIRMPVMDGLSATRKLRERQEFRNLPIIALTGNADEVSIQQCLAAGCNSHLAKPVYPRQVLEILGQFLE